MVKIPAELGEVRLAKNIIVSNLGRESKNSLAPEKLVERFSCEPFPKSVKPDDLGIPSPYNHGHIVGNSIIVRNIWELQGNRESVVVCSGASEILKLHLHVSISIESLCAWAGNYTHSKE